MSGLLAIETATDACSVAIEVDGVLNQRHEVAPRQHSQLLFALLRELLPSGDLRSHGIDCVAYGSGPGSFTGLRIAASAVQGLCFANDLQAVPVSTLAVLAQTACRLRAPDEDELLLAALDARINEVYAAVYEFLGDQVVLREGPWACTPEELTPVGARSMRLVGSGARFMDRFQPALCDRISGVSGDTSPEARDLITLARLAGDITQTPVEVQPVYVRDEIHWKKLSEQGRVR